MVYLGVLRWPARPIPQRLTEVTWDPSGSLLAVGSDSGGVYIYNVPDGASADSVNPSSYTPPDSDNKSPQPVLALISDSQSPKLAFVQSSCHHFLGADSDILLATAHGRTLRLWDVICGRCIQERRDLIPFTPAYMVRYGGRHLVCASDDPVDNMVVIDTWNLSVSTFLKAVAPGVPGAGRLCHLVADPVRESGGDGSVTHNGGHSSGKNSSDGPGFIAAATRGKISIWRIGFFDKLDTGGYDSPSKSAANSGSGTGLSSLAGAVTGAMNFAPPARLKSSPPGGSQPRDSSLEPVRSRSGSFSRPDQQASPEESSSLPSSPLPLSMQVSPITDSSSPPPQSKSPSRRPGPGLMLSNFGQEPNFNSLPSKNAHFQMAMPCLCIDVRGNYFLVLTASSGNVKVVIWKYEASSKDGLNQHFSVSVPGASPEDGTFCGFSGAVRGYVTHRNSRTDILTASMNLSEVVQLGGAAQLATSGSVDADFVLVKGVLGLHLLSLTEQKFVGGGPWPDEYPLPSTRFNSLAFCPGAAWVAVLTGVGGLAVWRAPKINNGVVDSANEPSWCPAKLSICDVWGSDDGGSSCSTLAKQDKMIECHASGGNIYIDGQKVELHSPHFVPSTILTVSGRYLCAGGAKGGFAIWQIRDKKLVHSQPVDGVEIVMVTRVWQFDGQGSAAHTPRGTKGPPVIVHPGLCCFADTLGRLHVFDLVDGIFTTFKVAPEFVRSRSFAIVVAAAYPTGFVHVIGGKTVDLWQLPAGNFLRALTAEDLRLEPSVSSLLQLPSAPLIETVSQGWELADLHVSHEVTAALLRIPFLPLLEKEKFLTNEGQKMPHYLPCVDKTLNEAEAWESHLCCAGASSHNHTVGIPLDGRITPDVFRSSVLLDNDRSASKTSSLPWILRSKHFATILALSADCSGAQSKEELPRIHAINPGFSMPLLCQIYLDESVHYDIRVRARGLLRCALRSPSSAVRLRPWFALAQSLEISDRFELLTKEPWQEPWALTALFLTAFFVADSHSTPDDVMGVELGASAKDVNILLLLRKMFQAKSYPLLQQAALQAVADGFPRWVDFFHNRVDKDKKKLDLFSATRFMYEVFGLYQDCQRIASQCQNILLQIGAHYPPELIDAMYQSAAKVHKGPNYASNALLVLVSILHKYPEQIVKHILLFVDSILRCLDPSNPVLRRHALLPATSACHELVKTFPMIGFHQGTQRFAVGSGDGPIIVYDLRTATKFRVLDGHNGKVDAVAFSYNGERVASYSAQDTFIKVWPLSSGNILSGFFQTSGKCETSEPVPAMPPLRPGDDPPGLRAIQILWADRTGEIRLLRDHAPPYSFAATPG